MIESSFQSQPRGGSKDVDVMTHSARSSITRARVCVCLWMIGQALVLGFYYTLIKFLLRKVMKWVVC